MPPAGAEIVNTLKIILSPMPSATYRLTADQRWDGSDAIYVLEGARERYDRIGEVPALFRTRLMSVRDFDHADEASMDARDPVGSSHLRSVHS